MRLSKASIVVIVIGVILVIMAPVWKWAIGPQFVKIPNNLDTTSEYEGTLKIYADPQSMSLYPPGQEQVQKLKITRNDKAIPSRSSSSVILVEEKGVVKDASTGKVLQLGWDKFYALDSKTAQNVSGHGSDNNRTGLTVLFPIGTQKNEYLFWDDDTGKTGAAKFVKEETIEGVKHKSVKVLVFDVKGTPDKMSKPPLGLPAELPGSVIKTILGNPAMPISDTMMLPIDYFKKTDARIVAEPKTGSIVDVPRYREEYYVNTALAPPPNYLTLATLDYAQTRLNVKMVVDDSAKYFGMLDLNAMWLPLIFLVVGLILIVIGLFLGRKPGASKPSR